MVFAPYVLEGKDEKRVWDIWSRLNKDRIVFVGSDITSVNANVIVAQLLYLESMDKEEDIYMYINSPGGVVTGGLGIYDTMCYIKPDVATICVGQACSMGAVLLSAGAKGKRYSLPNSRIMLHQLRRGGGSIQTYADIKIDFKEVTRMHEQLTKIIAKHTGKTYEEVDDACERDKFMSPEQAKEFGVIDEILVRG